MKSRRTLINNITLTILSHSTHTPYLNHTHATLPNIYMHTHATTPRPPNNIHVDVPKEAAGVWYGPGCWWWRRGRDHATPPTWVLGSGGKKGRGTSLGLPPLPPGGFGQGLGVAPAPSRQHRSPLQRTGLVWGTCYCHEACLRHMSCCVMYIADLS